MGPRLRLGAHLLIAHKGEHLFQGGPVVNAPQVVPHHPHQLRQNHWAGETVGAEAVGVVDLSIEGVFHLPDVDFGVAHEPQQLHRIGGEVALGGQQGTIVVQPQAVQLPGVGVLVILVAEGAHLHPGDVVQHLSHKPV